ncbi:hypothetical protein GCM10022197_13190 [Microlunatus spumicola]|uniref:Uncharacterized protein n=1 Tax=Microlunatus spumicola TaxID=81499 RepID=A0ABP6X0T7_9ACTN
MVAPAPPEPSGRHRTDHFPEGFGHTGGVTDPAPTTLRRRLEVVSRPALVRLTALPRPVVPLVTVVLFAVAVLAPPAVALVALVLIGLFLVWLTFLAWPAVGAGGRAMRLAMVALVVVLGVTRF